MLLCVHVCVLCVCVCVCCVLCVCVLCVVCVCVVCVCCVLCVLCVCVCSFVCRFVLPALLWVATVIIEYLPNIQKVTDVHSLSMKCHSIKLGTNVLNPRSNNLESFSHRNMKMSITYN